MKFFSKKVNLSVRSTKQGEAISLSLSFFPPKETIIVNEMFLNVLNNKGKESKGNPESLPKY